MLSVFARILSWFKTLIARLTRRETVNDPDLPVIDPGSQVVVYYGCPNSKRTAKLRLGKRAVR